MTGSFWRSLQCKKSLIIQAEDNSQLGWGGLGRAAVQIFKDEQGRVIFEERGIWESGPHAASQFFNRYRWSLCQGTLSLEHLRQGEDRAILLYEWELSSNRAKLISPHVCGDDCYMGHLSWSENAFSLTCQVRGKRKNGSVRSTYFDS